MSFDVFLQRFKAGKPAEVDRAAVLEVLRGVEHTRNEFGTYRVCLPDGAFVEFSADGLEAKGEFTGCSLSLRGFSHSIVQFMFDVARAGDMVIFPAMEESVVGLVARAQSKHLPPDLSEDFRRVVLRSGRELGALLSGGFDAWSDYRDQVLQQSAARTRRKTAPWSAGEGQSIVKTRSRPKSKSKATTKAKNTSESKRSK